MATPEQLFGQARTVLLLEQPFFGSLALRLQPKVDETCNTAWTDGTSIGYNPKWFSGLTPSQRVGLLAHEVMHIALGHPFRRDGREPKRFNDAADYALNPIVKEAGMELPPDGLLDPKYAGLSAEAIYSMLPPDPPGDNSGGNGNGEGEEWGEVRDSPDPTSGETGESAWKQATVQAAIQEKMRQGSLSAEMQRLVNAIKTPPCKNLLAALAEFVAHSAKEDYSWKRPNTRFIPMGLYLPTLHSESLPPIAAIVDTSGSITEEILQEFVGALQTVLDTAKPEALTVLSCDAAVKAEATYAPGDLLAGKAASYPGGGGTNFIPSLKRLEEMDTPPVCAIYLTDLYGSFPSVPPPFPVLWAVIDRTQSRMKVPFGEAIYLER